VIEVTWLGGVSASSSVRSPPLRTLYSEITEEDRPRDLFDEMTLKSRVYDSGRM